MAKYFAGIGSRETPDDVLEQMRELAKLAARLNWSLRSGAAPGADTAFEQGCDLAGGLKEIMLPWKGFNGSTSPYAKHNEAAFQVASVIHPAWSFLKPAAKQLAARNMQQIMGEDMNNPVKCVICWTRDGARTHREYSHKTGGTGTAIALASLFDIPVFNLKRPLDHDMAVEFLQSV